MEVVVRYCLLLLFFGLFLTEGELREERFQVDPFLNEPLPTAFKMIWTQRVRSFVFEPEDGSKTLQIGWSGPLFRFLIADDSFDQL